MQELCTNRTLRRERDPLTGLYGSAAFQHRVEEQLEKDSAGVLLLLNLDRFGSFNIRYGFRMGDLFLQEVSRILRLMIFPDDLLGRVGADSFAIFIPVEQNETFVEERAQQIQARIRGLRVPGSSARITLTASGCTVRPGESYELLMKRAEEQLLCERGEQTLDLSPSPNLCSGVEVDLQLIHQDLALQEQAPGAYCQDYDTFQRIYRFVERRLRRMGNGAYVVLFTLTDGQGDLPLYTTRVEQMETLKEIIQTSLRAGDLFTQYSSCQFLVLLTDLSQENTERVAQRICNTYYQEFSEEMEHLLLIDFFPIHPNPEP